MVSKPEVHKIGVHSGTPMSQFLSSVSLKNILQGYGGPQEKLSGILRIFGKL